MGQARSGFCISVITCAAVKKSPASDTRNALPTRSRILDVEALTVTQSKGATERFTVLIGSVRGCSPAVGIVYCAAPAGEGIQSNATSPAAGVVRVAANQSKAREI